MFLVDIHFQPLRERADFRSFLAQQKPVWESLREEFGNVASSRMTQPFLPA